MQKYIVLLFLGLFFVTTNASNLTIQPRFTNSFRFTSTDVWNIDVQFTGAGNLNAYVLATITADGRPVCTLKSGTILLTPGAQSFTSASISTAQLNYQSQAIADIENITGTFPSGNYKICYNAYCVTANCDGLGSNALYNEYPECFEMLVEPPTPLLLAFPEDKAELEWKRPTFNWIPPMPLAGVAGFNYEYLMVERDKNQTCADAIVRNRPLYKQAAIDQPTLPYPAELNDLDTGKVYCWKVNGLVEDIPVAQSEVWEFRLKKEEKEKHGNVSIVPSNVKGNEIYSLHMEDTMTVSFLEEITNLDNSLNIEILDIGLNEVVHTKTMIVHPSNSTSKYYKLRPVDFNADKGGHYYQINLSSQTGEVWYFTISIVIPQ